MAKVRSRGCSHEVGITNEGQEVHDDRAQELVVRRRRVRESVTDGRDDRCPRSWAFVTNTFLNERSAKVSIKWLDSTYVELRQVS